MLKRIGKAFVNTDKIIEVIIEPPEDPNSKNRSERTECIWLLVEGADLDGKGPSKKWVGDSEDLFYPDVREYLDQF